MKRHNASQTVFSTEVAETFEYWMSGDICDRECVVGAVSPRVELGMGGYICLWFGYTCNLVINLLLCSFLR